MHPYGSYTYQEAAPLWGKTDTDSRKALFQFMHHYFVMPQKFKYSTSEWNDMQLESTCDQIDHIPVRRVEILDCKTGYRKVAAIPIAALIPRAMPMIYAGMPSHSSVAVIKVPKLQ